ncbi:MAG: hypothetical protein MPJ22_09070, partial [Pirellulales bacterium]|nr:hypothetical protein [Pirellulales bacterium]
MPLFQFASHLFSPSRGRRRRQAYRREFCHPEMLERRAMLTGTNTSFDNTPGEALHEPLPIVSE